MGIYLFLTFVILVAEHYLPWNDWCYALFNRRMHVTVNYMLGVLGFILPYSLYLYEQGQPEAAHTSWYFVVAAGLSVLASYALDWLRNQLQTARLLKELENAQDKRTE